MLKQPLLFFPSYLPSSLAWLTLLLLLLSFLSLPSACCLLPAVRCCCCCLPHRVLSVEPDARKVSLSMKADLLVGSEEEEEEGGDMAGHKVGSCAHFFGGRGSRVGVLGWVRGVKGHQRVRGSESDQRDRSGQVLLSAGSFKGRGLSVAVQCVYGGATVPQGPTMCAVLWLPCPQPACWHICLSLSSLLTSFRQHPWF